VKAKLMNRVVGTEQVELSLLELGVHLQDGNLILWILKRGHRWTTPTSNEIGELQGAQGEAYFLYIVSFTASTLFYSSEKDLER
jgi:hypothetical protein